MSQDNAKFTIRQNTVRDRRGWEKLEARESIALLIDDHERQVALSDKAGQCVVA